MIHYILLSRCGALATPCRAYLPHMLFCRRSLAWRALSTRCSGAARLVFSRCTVAFGGNLQPTRHVYMYKWYVFSSRREILTCPWQRSLDEHSDTAPATPPGPETAGTPGYGVCGPRQ